MYKGRNKVQKKKSVTKKMAEDGVEPGYAFERILAKWKGRGKQNKVWYLVKWWGLSEKSNTWEPEDRLREDVPDEVDKFEKRYDGKNQITFHALMEEILDRRVYDHRLEYQVKWRGMDAAHITWETFGDVIKDCPEMVESFEIKRELAIEQKIAAYQHIKLEKQDDPMDDKQASTSAAGDVENESTRMAEEIYGVTEKNGELHFLVKWQHEDDADVVPCSQANILWPELVIKFYEERMTWDKDYSLDYGKQSSIPESCNVDRVAEKIIGLTEDDGDIYFLIKWKNSADASLLPRCEANRQWPQVVIRFYEENLTVEDGRDSPDQIEEEEVRSDSPEQTTAEEDGNYSLEQVEAEEDGSGSLGQTTAEQDGNYSLDQLKADEDENYSLEQLKADEDGSDSQEQMQTEEGGYGSLELIKAYEDGSDSPEQTTAELDGNYSLGQFKAEEDGNYSLGQLKAEEDGSHSMEQLKAEEDGSRSMEQMKAEEEDEESDWDYRWYRARK